MSNRLRLALLLLVTLVIAGCGKARHVFPPGVAIQQLTAEAAGTWKVNLRFNNFSYDAAVRFKHLSATLTIGGKPAGKLDCAFDLDIAARSADSAETTVTANPAARAALAKLAGDASIAYSLAGTVSVSDEDGKGERHFPVHHDGYLSPVPGIAGTYR